MSGRSIVFWESDVACTADTVCTKAADYAEEYGPAFLNDVADRLKELSVELSARIANEASRDDV